jgi:hypothetical protein
MGRTASNAALHDESSLGAVRMILLGFIAGTVAVPAFHQLMLVVLNAAGFASNQPWVTTPVAPFDVPRIASLSFWGGVWGIVFALAQARFPRGARFVSSARVVESRSSA